MAIRESCGQIVGGDGSEPLQRPEGGTAHGGIGIVEEGPSRGLIALVSRDGRSAAATLCVG